MSECHALTFHSFGSQESDIQRRMSFPKQGSGGVGQKTSDVFVGNIWPDASEVSINSSYVWTETLYCTSPVNSIENLEEG